MLNEVEVSGELAPPPPSSNTESILTVLKDRGHRITKVRRALLDVFHLSAGPVSVIELGEALAASGLRPNKTTFYREVEFLVKEGILHEVDLLDGRKRYELAHIKGQHHHLVCRSCNAVRCVEIEQDVEQLGKKVASQFNFQVQSQVLEFFGYCGDCKQ